MKIVLTRRAAPQARPRAAATAAKPRRADARRPAIEGANPELRELLHGLWIMPAFLALWAFAWLVTP